MHNDKRVDEYIASLQGWQQEICATIRRLVHDAAPEIEETIKRTNRPYFTLNGNVCALLGTKDHVNVFIYDPTADDPGHLINQGEGNLTAKAIQIYEGDHIDESSFKHLIQSVVAHNRAGGWRKLSKE